MKNIFFVLIFVIVNTVFSEDNSIEKMSLEELMNITVVTAGKIPERIGDIPASVVVITHEEIMNYGYQSITEILESTPGLYLVNDYLEQNFGVRGYWTMRGNRNVKILINNNPLPDDAFSDNHLELSMIPVTAIEKIEIVRGPMSVMYGSGAFFGVINIFTTNDNLEHDTSSVSVAYGSNSTLQIPFKTQGFGENYSFSCIASYSKSDGIGVPYEHMVHDSNVLTGLGIPIGQTTEGYLTDEFKYFNFSGKYKQFSLDVIRSDDKRGSIFLFPSSDKADIRARANMVALGYQFKVSPTVTINFKSSLHEFQWDFTVKWLYEDFYGHENDSSLAYSFQVRSTYTPNDRFDLVSGIDYYSVADAAITWDLPSFPGFADNFWRLDDGETITLQSMYSQANWKASRYVSIVGGLRIEQMLPYSFSRLFGSETGLSGKHAEYNNSDIELIPRFAVIYQPKENQVFKFMYGRAINRPSMMQNMDVLYNDAMKTLVPEEITTYELNYLAETANGTVNLSIFHNRLSNLIQRSLFISGPDVFRLHANVGEMITNGIEITVQTKLWDRFRIEANAMIQRTIDEQKGMEDIEPGYSPRFLGYLKMIYSVTSDLSISTTGNFIGSMESYWDKTLTDSENPYGKRLGNTIDAYTVIGLNFHMNNFIKNDVYVNFRISNLLNKEIFYPTTANNNWADMGTIGPGRTMLFTVGTTF